MSSHFVRSLVQHSRDRSTILKVSGGIMVVSVILALLLSLAPDRFEAKHGRESHDLATLTDLITWIRFGTIDLSPSAQTLDCRNLIDHQGHPLAGGINAVIDRFSDDPSSNLVHLWWSGLSAEDSSSAIAGLEALSPQTRYRNEFLGDLRYKKGESKAAIQDYLAEGTNESTAVYARRSALYLASLNEEKVLLKEMLSNESFRRSLEAPEYLRITRQLRDYDKMAYAVFQLGIQFLNSPYLFLGLFTAAIWAGILFSFRSTTGRFAVLALFAFLLGTLSALLALYASVVQEGFGGGLGSIEEAPTQQILYFVMGVGLREEFTKLLCFAPLLLFLRSQDRALDALLLGGFVGLGFAFEENLAYFQGDSATQTAWLRLLTANALHFSLTGIAAHALWRVVRRRFHGSENFLLTFAAVVGAHTLYNAMITMPLLSDYKPLAPILVAVVAYQYFDPLRQHLDTKGLHRRLAPLGIFVIGLVLLSCAVLLSSVFVVPFRYALGNFANTIASMIPIAYAFISRFRDL